MNYHTSVLCSEYVLVTLTNIGFYDKDSVNYFVKLNPFSKCSYKK